MGAAITIQPPISFDVESNAQEASRNKVAGLLEIAFTREELDAARHAYETHLRQWPEDQKRDMAHRIPRALDYQKQRAAEVARLGLSEADIALREELLRPFLQDYEDAVGAKAALLSIASRRSELDRWLSRFPEDRHVQEARSSLEQDEQTASLIAGIAQAN